MHIFWHTHQRIRNNSRAGRDGNPGLTLIDVIVGVAIAGLLLAAVFGMFNTSLTVIFDANARSQAIALAEQRMEYIRSLPYRDIGTKGGIPAGELQEDETIKRDSISFNRRTFVQYYDDAADGTGDDDSNNIQEDYKRAKVEVTWQDGSQTKSVESAGFIVPDGIESSEGGGTLSLHVFDAVGDPVADAEVRIENPSTSPAIDTTTFTNASGTTKFSGAPASSNYQVTVSKPGYSTARTYDQTETNVAPDPGHLTVASSSVTSASFPIDVLSDITLHTKTPIRSASYTEPFADATGIADSKDITVDNNKLQLSQSGGSYATSGFMYTLTFGTSTVRRWDRLTFTATTSANTQARLHLVDKTENGYNRLSDQQLDGNESGFVSSPVDLSSIATSTHDQLAAEVVLETAATDTTPTVGELAVEYTAGRMPKPDVDLYVRGDKTIGKRADGSSIYKHTFSTTTNASGTEETANVEWDTYHLRPQSTSSQRVVAACPQEPFPLSPGTSTALTLAVTGIDGQSDHSLRVDVNAGGESVTQATTTLSRSGFTSVDTTGPCGQSFFANLTESDKYTLTIESANYTKETINNVSVTNDTMISVDISN